MQVIPADTADYNTPADQTVRLTVNPAVLTVTAGNATRTYGAANPAFSYPPWDAAKPSDDPPEMPRTESGGKP